MGILALGLVAQSLTPLFARAFYARQNTKTPVAISLTGMLINAVFSYSLAQGLGVVGIALGFVIASTVQCILLFIYLHRVFKNDSKASPKSLEVFDSTIVTQSLKILLASILLGLATYATLYVMDPLVNTHTVIGIFLQAGIATTVGSVVYIVATRAWGILESEAIWRGVLKLWRFIRKQA